MWRQHQKCPHHTRLNTPDLLNRRRYRKRLANRSGEQIETRSSSTRVGRLFRASVLKIQEGPSCQEEWCAVPCRSLAEGTRGSRSVNPDNRSLPKRSNRRYERLLRPFAGDL